MEAESGPESARGEQQSEESARIPLQPVRVLLDPRQPPKMFHKIIFTALSGDVSLEFGFLDLREGFDLLQAYRSGTLPKDEAQTTHLYITDRFFLTPQSGLELLRVASRAVEHFQRLGLLPQDLSQATSSWMMDTEVLEPK